MGGEERGRTEIEGEGRGRKRDIGKNMAGTARSESHEPTQGTANYTRSLSNRRRLTPSPWKEATVSVRKRKKEATHWPGVP